MSWGSFAGADAAEAANALEEKKGCAIVDSGATVMCSPTLAAEEIQMQRLNHQEPGVPSVNESDRRFRFADGHIDEAQTMVDSRSHQASCQEALCDRLFHHLLSFADVSINETETTV